MKEQKIDRFIRKTVNENHNLKPSPEFTENILEKLGVKTTPAVSKPKPIRNKWGLILTVSLYILIMVSLLVIPQNQESTMTWIPQFSLPAIGDYLNVSSNVYKMILILIMGGWILLIADNFVKKLFLR